MTAIRVESLSKSFKRGTYALRDVDLHVDRGEMVALIGASGAGKSTLLRHVPGLLSGNLAKGCGRIEVLGTVVQDGGRIARGIRRTRSSVGFIFQQFNLVGRLSVLTNVLLGRLGQVPGWRGSLGLFTAAEKRAAMDALQRVAMDQYASQRASTLSGGQQQRAAIARTIVQGAEIILADEPIASLDPASSTKVMENLKRINQEDGVTVVVSLHQVDYALTFCPRTVAMRDGSVVYDGPSAALTPEFLRELYGADSEEILSGQKRERPRAGEAGIVAPAEAAVAYGAA